ncbi:AAA family ATPase [Marinobacterium ramblicola]|uniref:AAA family ATPase n=1 Tax=Marinobacterium ramblicola TaxID=2849041 RepID=UPI001C2DB22D|nr:AAA family ATPase [Marinobacterium ramblicola]
MRHLLRFSDLMLLIIGVDGSGKSTLLQQLEVDERTDDVRRASISCDDTVDVTRLLSSLVSALQIDCPADADNRTRLRALHGLSRDLHEAGVPLLLIIDDADYLTNNALELLTNFALLDEAAPRVVLTGTPDFEQRFIGNGLDQQLDGRLHVQLLSAFEPQESREYIESLLPPGTELSARKMRRLIDESQGLPGRLAAGVRRQIQQGGITRGSARSFPLPGLHAAAIGGVLLVILAASVWLYLPEPEPETEQTARVVMPIEIPAAAVEDEVRVVDVRSELQQKLAEQERRLESQAEDPVSVVPAPVTAEAGRVVDDGGQDSPADGADPATGQVAAAEQPAASERTVEPVKAAPVEAAGTSVAAVDVPKASNQTARSVAEEKPAAESANPGSSVLLRSDELLQWPDKGYTLQLLGAREAASVEQFIKAQSSPERFYYFRTIYKGAPWHVVVYGQFSDRASAMAAVQTLPEALRKLRPWARSIAGVKSDIRKQ